MALTWSSFTTTPIFNQPALAFPTVGTIPSNGMPGVFYIPTKLTKLSAQDEGSIITETSYGSIIDLTSNIASGGTALTQGPNKISKISMEGYIDTPITSTANPLPNIVVDGYNMTFGEILAAYFEGRTSSNTQGFYQLTRPNWFRDPYGRVYSSITLYDLTVSKVEGSPFRETFTMQLVVS